jgi:Cys-tRNA(Pro) deacylase
MLAHPTRPDSPIVELADLEHDPLPAEIAAHREALHTVVGWAESYLTRPHPELGRSGPVCPFVQASMRRKHFYLTVVPGADLGAAEVEERLVELRDWFLARTPRDGEADASLKTLLIVFPDLPRERVPVAIDAVQERLKPLYVPNRLMIGEFHDGPPDKAGLWNDDFRPLHSPLPMLVIRHMVATDFAFLKDDGAELAAYLANFGGAIPAHLREKVQETAEAFGLYFPDPELLESVHPAVAATLWRQRVRVGVVRHRDLEAPQQGPHDAARALGWPIERITKSLFVHSGGDYAVVVCPVNRRVDLEAVAEHLGTGRLQLASQAELSAWLGYSAGGVTPIGCPADVRVVIDESLLQWPTILTAAGEVAVEVEIDPEDLRRITGASVLPISRPVGEGTEQAVKV